MKTYTKIKIHFTHPDGKEDFEIVQDLWCAARELRPEMPKYNDIENVRVEVTAV